MKRTNIGSAFFIFFMLFLFVSTFISCSKYTYSNKYNNKFIADSKIVDYSNLHYWAAHPWKKDASDSVPKPLLNTLKQDSLADVFFIHPTTLINKKENYWNADIDNLELNKKTLYYLSKSKQVKRTSLSLVRSNTDLGVVCGLAQYNDYYIGCAIGKYVKVAYVSPVQMATSRVCSVKPEARIIVMQDDNDNLDTTTVSKVKNTLNILFNVPSRFEKLIKK